MKRNGGDTTAVGARPIATSGEVFADGATIELIGDAHSADVQLMLWDGSKEIVGPVVQHGGKVYEPAPIASSIQKQLILPTHCSGHGSTRDFLMEIRNLVVKFVGQDETSASLIARIVLCSAIIEAVSVAPALVISGPDIARSNRLTALLRCLCRHAVSLTSVTPAGFCSLANGARFTYLISQSTVSDRLRALLNDASSRDRNIPFRGGLLDLFGVQVIHSAFGVAGNSWPHRSIQIEMIPTGQELPRFDQDVQLQIVSEFQAKLLSFRRANLSAARRIEFDTSKFSFALTDLAHALAAATPDEAELQAEVFELLRAEDAEIRSDRWTDSSVVAAQAVLVAFNESPGGMTYVSQLAEIAEEIFAGRGEETKCDPGKFGKQLKTLGFTTEARDAKGKKLHLTETVRGHALQLLHNFDGLESWNVGPVEADRRAL